MHAGWQQSERRRKAARILCRNFIETGINDNMSLLSTNLNLISSDWWLIGQKTAAGLGTHFPCGARFRPGPRKTTSLRSAQSHAHGSRKSSTRSHRHACVICRFVHSVSGVSGERRLIDGAVRSLTRIVWRELRAAKQLGSSSRNNFTHARTAAVDSDWKETSVSPQPLDIWFGSVQRPVAQLTRAHVWKDFHLWSWYIWKVGKTSRASTAACSCQCSYTTSWTASKGRTFGCSPPFSTSGSQPTTDVRSRWLTPSGRIGNIDT